MVAPPSPSPCRYSPRPPLTTADTVVHIVDDEEAVRNSLAFLLSGAGFAVRVHDSATQFLAIAGGIRNGCLITDLRMPDMDGVELLRKLRDAGALLPAIVITGHGDVQMAVEAMKNGALDFIEKPFSDQVLIDSIARAVERADEQVSSEAAEELVRQRVASLSERERQVLNGVVAGQPNKTIAFELGISPRTVEVYRAGLMGKMQARSLAELVRMVMDIGYDPTE
ncbi:MAG: response regulator transcription factor FixJ [Devosia sp.]|nr:response regulator transcription factor FixJ [Devosia sp.]